MAKIIAKKMPYIRSGGVYTTPTITGGTIENGGYYKSSEGIVVINVRFTASSSTVTISGLPKGIINSNIYSLSVMRMDNNSHPNAFGYISGSGEMRIEGLSTGSYIVNATYLS